MNLQVVEHISASYAPRTYHNATTADLTLAIAIDFNTAGEKLTKKAAGDKYLAINYAEDYIVAARKLYKECKSRQVKTLNIAGNSLYTFIKQDIHQEDINKTLYTILNLVQQHYKIEHIVSGGQTGMDIAAGVVATVLGIPCTMTYPKGYKIRAFSGEDVEMPKEQLLADIEGYVHLLKEEIKNENQ